MSQSDAPCTLLVAVPPKTSLPSQAELLSELEQADVVRKRAALKSAVLALLAGGAGDGAGDAAMPRVLMAVIRYCMTSEDHAVQKLLMLYWECARKVDAMGRLLPEMILVCNALRNNLIHPNE